MSITVRSVDLDREQEQLVEILERNLLDAPHRRRFDWLYRQNPAGRAWSWFACDPDGDRLVGVASLVPRAVWVRGEVQRCAQVVDFAIDVTHRSLGPAVMLQRATLAPVDQGVLAFCYDCPPHGRGMAPLRRLGMVPTNTTRRYVKLLRTEHLLETRLGRGWHARAAAWLANLGLGIRSRYGRREAGIEIVVHGGPFGEEFTALDRALRSADMIRARRSAEDLSWRYQGDPTQRYDVLTARRHGELIAFVVTLSRGDNVLVADLFGHLSSVVVAALIDAAANHTSRGSAQALETTVGAGGALADVLTRCGWWSRGQGPQVVGYAPSGSDTRRLLEQPRSWRLQQVDLMG